MTDLKYSEKVTKEAKEYPANLYTEVRGTVSVEQIVILSTVAVGFVTAMVAVGPMLLNYHSSIEFVLAMPFP